MTENATPPMRVAVLAGDDTIARERAKEQLVKAIRQAYPNTLIERYDSAAGTFSDYLEGMLSPSLFQEMRICIIGHAQALNDRDCAALDRTIDHLPEDIFIIVEVGDVTKGKKGASKTVQLLHAEKRAKKDPHSFLFRLFQKPPDYKIAQWLMEQVPSLCGRTISKADAEYLVDMVGYDIDLLSSEVQKIDIHLDAGSPVSRAAINTVVGASRQMTVFELAAACAAKQAQRVLTIVDSLFTTTFYGPMMISALTRHYWALFRIRQYAKNNPQDVKAFLQSKGFSNPAQNEAAFRIGCAAGLLRVGEQRKVYPVIIASGIVKQAQHYTDRELKQILAWLLEFDFGIKTGRLASSRQEVELFCFKLLRITELVQEGLPG